LGELDDVVCKIRRRAEKINDDEVRALADEVISLLRRLSMQYLLEDEEGTVLGTP
jgi:hypothetical protein